MKKTRRTLTPEERAKAAYFHAAGLVLMPTCICGEAATEVHHVVDAQELRSENATRASNHRHGINTLLPLIDVYDLDNGLGLCELCHVRHTRAIKRVSRRNLRVENYAFARAVSRLWFIDRYYPDAPVEGGLPPSVQTFGLIV